MKIKFLDLHEQYLSIKENIDKTIFDVINDSAFIGGSSIEAFQEKFKNYQDVNYFLGVGNGTDALEIAIEALDLPKRSEIIVPANSFISSAEAVSRMGFRAVFCDVNPDDYTINIEDLKKRINKNTSAIVAVHLYGHPCQMRSLLNLADEYSLKIIEDCAQAHGAEFEGKKVGGIGHIGCWSFYPGKNLGAYGDAGGISTNDENLFLKCKKIANHGRLSKYNHEFEGRNSRLDNLQAAILNVKLDYLEEWTDHRIIVADEYISCLKDINELTLPKTSSSVKHVFHLFVVRTSNREAIKSKLLDAGVETGIHYPIALPKLKAFNYLDQANEKGFAWVSDKELLSLPIHGNFKLTNIKYIRENL
tara:strand:- start:2373 stop:3458 length:1086 start_codon:yes stop_codon:yes gene_type:complete